MRIVLQRVKRASVKVDESVVGAIQRGILLLLAIHRDDTKEQAEFLAHQCVELRIFPDREGKMNLSLEDIRGAALVVSQFTLYGDSRKGRRPSFSEAAHPEMATAIYDFFIQILRQRITPVEQGMFGASMEVELVNEGPVTLILEK
jgi:D-tyrosyl-tRNA(Tyr) deacylase